MLEMGFVVLEDDGHFGVHWRFWIMEMGGGVGLERFKAGGGWGFFWRGFKEEEISM